MSAGGDVAWSEEQQSAVLRKQLRVASGGARAYESLAVDDFLDRVATAMGLQQDLPDLSVSFSAPKSIFGGGYDAAQVDQYLRLLGELVPGEEPVVHAPPTIISPVLEGVNPNVPGLGFGWSAAQRESVVQVSLAKATGFGKAGYDEAAVDEFLNRVVAAMDRQRPLPDGTAVTFGKARGLRRSGYDTQQVDDLMDRLAHMVPED